MCATIAFFSNSLFIMSIFLSALTKAEVLLFWHSICNILTCRSEIIGGLLLLAAEIEIES